MSRLQCKSVFTMFSTEKYAIPYIHVFIQDLLDFGFTLFKILIEFIICPTFYSLIDPVLS